MPRQEVTVTLIKQFKYPKAVFAQGKVTDNEAKRLALTDMANELNINVREDQFDAFMINDGTYSLKNSSITLKANHVASIARILAQEEIENKYGPLDPVNNAKLYKFDSEGNPYLKGNIDDEMHGIRHSFEDRLHRALFTDAGIDPNSRRNARNNSAIERLQEELRQQQERRRSMGIVEDAPVVAPPRWSSFYQTPTEQPINNPQPISLEEEQQFIQDLEDEDFFDEDLPEEEE